MKTKAPRAVALAIALAFAATACNVDFRHHRYEGGDGTYGGGSVAGLPAPPAAPAPTDVPVAQPDPGSCGGATYDVPECAACADTSCCAEESACASDPDCIDLETCRAQCTDADCLDQCNTSLPPSDAADGLDACLADACADVCF